ncbi:MAG: DnaJ domain-containing protein [Chakrabartia sp.]
MTRFLLFIAVLGVLYWIWSDKKLQSGEMTRDEAARLLGVPAHAGPAEVQSAYKRLIAKVHPDTGGSAELAARVNQARNVMLGEDGR